MKKTILIVSSILFIVSLLISSCNSPSDKLKESEENLTEATTNFHDAKSDFLAEVESFKTKTAIQIAVNDSLIAVFEEEMRDNEKEIKAVYREKVVELKETNKELKERLLAFEAEDKTGWQKFKEEFSSDMKKLGAAFKDLTVNNVK